MTINNLSIEGWLDGISSLIILVFGFVFGLIVIYKSLKLEGAKLLTYGGFNIFFSCFLGLGFYIDFFTILSTGSNIIASNSTLLLLYEWWVPIDFVFAMILGAELLTSNKKNIIIILSIILCISWEVMLIYPPLHEGAAIFIYPDPLGTDLIEVQMNLFTFTGIFFIGLLTILYTVFIIFGFMIKGIKSAGMIKKKFMLLSTGAILISSAILMDILFSLGSFVIFSRSAALICMCFYYYGLRPPKEKPIKPAKFKPRRMFDIDESSITLIESLSASKPENISEEEITYYREQKICLVCKGKVGGFNIFLCTGCDSLYCQKCALVLSDLENSCWACDIPIDETKPTRSLTVDEDEVAIQEDIHKERKK